MGFDWLFSDDVRAATERLSAIGGACLGLMIAYEWAMGRYRNGKKTRIDWTMGALCISMLALVQRPLLMAGIFLVLTTLVPQYAGVLRPLEIQHFWVALAGFLLIDEYLHGAVHLFAHRKPPAHPFLRRIHSFYRVAHRPHHQIGGNDGKGELSVTQTYVEHWGWWLFLPNYWFGLASLYFGLIEVFLWGTLIKSVWGMHVHTNWGRGYDVVLLNHPSSFVRRGMRALCHLLVFPNQHQQHHSRGANSAKNMTNFIALFDWLLWGTLAIENARPAVFGWKQTRREEHSALYRYFNTDLRRG